MSKIIPMLVLVAGILLKDGFGLKINSPGRRQFLIKRSPSEPDYSPNSNNYSSDNSNGGDGRPNIIADNYGTAAGQPENDAQLCLQCPSNSFGILGQLRSFLGNGLGVFTLLNSAIDEYSPLGAFLFSLVRSLNNFVTGCTNLNGILPTSDD